MLVKFAHAQIYHCVSLNGYTMSTQLGKRMYREGAEMAERDNVPPPVMTDSGRVPRLPVRLDGTVTYDAGLYDRMGNPKKRLPVALGSVHQYSVQTPLPPVVPTTPTRKSAVRSAPPTGGVKKPKNMKHRNFCPRKRHLDGNGRWRASRW